jgi:chromosome partitioning protein
MRKIALVNQKGGCGKTTTAVNLAASLAALDRPVLLIDLDPQGHSTLALGTSDRSGGVTLFDLLCGEKADQLSIGETTVPVYECLDLVPSDFALSTAEQRLLDLPLREERLRRKIEELTQPYDFIIIDCPPNLGILTINALVAANEVIVPLDPGIYSLQGLTALEKTLTVLRDRLGHSVEERIVPNRIDRRIKYHRRFIGDLCDRYPDEILPVAIRRSVKVTEAASRGRPVLHTARRSGVAEDFKRLAAEVIGEDFDEMADEFRLRPVEALPVEFTLERPGARMVSVAGTFNNWKPDKTFLVGPDETGKWHTSIQLTPGEYEYRFIVDGEWMPDPRNPDSVASPVGGRNSLVRVDVPRPQPAEESVPLPSSSPRITGQEEVTDYHG